MGRPSGSKNKHYTGKFNKCLICNKSFYVYLVLIKRGKGKYCSRSCQTRGMSGRKFSEITRKRMSESGKKVDKSFLIGRKQSIESQKKRSESLKLAYKMNPELWLIGGKKRSGENNTNWKGGVTKEVEKIRKSVRYKIWRKTIFERDDYTCQKCFIKGGELNADHIKPFSLYPELRFELLNGRTLCVPCHKIYGAMWGRKKEVVKI